MLVKAFLIYGTEIESFHVDVDDQNYMLVRKKLEEVHNSIIDLLKSYKTRGLIDSLSRPKNKQMKNHLNELVDAKRKIKNSIKIIKNIYYK